jgi:hypothetical protein
MFQLFAGEKLQAFVKLEMNVSFLYLFTHQITKICELILRPQSK